jgi:hypothetical protein
MTKPLPAPRAETERHRVSGKTWCVCPAVQRKSECAVKWCCCIRRLYMFLPCSKVWSLGDIFPLYLIIYAKETTRHCDDFSRFIRIAMKIQRMLRALGILHPSSWPAVCVMTNVITITTLRTRTYKFVCRVDVNAMIRYRSDDWVLVPGCWIDFSLHTSFSEAQPTSHPLCSFPGVKWLEREADHSSTTNGLYE